ALALTRFSSCRLLKLATFQLLRRHVIPRQLRDANDVGELRRDHDVEHLAMIESASTWSSFLRTSACLPSPPGIEKARRCAPGRGVGGLTPQGGATFDTTGHATRLAAERWWLDLR